MKLSDQALGAVMMALQKSLLEQSDIVPVLKGFELETRNGELFVAVRIKSQASLSPLRLTRTSGFLDVSTQTSVDGFKVILPI